MSMQQGVSERHLILLALVLNIANTVIVEYGLYIVNDVCVKIINFWLFASRVKKNISCGTYTVLILHYKNKGCFYTI